MKYQAGLGPGQAPVAYGAGMEAYTEFTSGSAALCSWGFRLSTLDFYYQPPLLHNFYSQPLFLQGRSLPMHHEAQVSLPPSGPFQVPAARMHRLAVQPVELTRSIGRI
jgi:hypothetical protein